MVEFYNPATGQKLGDLVAADGEAVRAAYEKSRSAFARWSAYTLVQRLQHLENGKLWLIKNFDSIVEAISLNNGKPRVEAMIADLAPAIQSINYYKRNAEKFLRDEPISIRQWLPTKKSYLSYSPLGVIGIISPWNYPFSIPMGEVIAALVAGNCVILKPSEVTSLINKKIKEFAEACRLPEGVFQIIEGDGHTGADLASLPLSRLIFTGSVPTGKKVMHAAAENLVPVTLELGGKDPCIVLEDADIEVASSGVVVGGYFNNGQTCCSVERLLVHKSIEKEFVSILEVKLSKLRVGNSQQFDNDLGPITYSPQKKILKDQIDASESNSQYNGQDSFMRPLLIKSNETQKVWNDESFGPIVAYDTFDTETEAIEKANKNTYGLGAVIWSGNTARAEKIAKQLYAGTVVINDAPHTNAVAALPWGGAKYSGFGRVHGKEGLRDMCLVRVISSERLGQIKQIWWYPYGKQQYDTLKSYSLFLAETRFASKIYWFLKFVARFLKMEKRA